MDNSLTPALFGELALSVATTDTSRPRSRLRVVVKVLHLLWALPCLAVTILLALATDGHPPGIIFVPVAVAVWLLGHGVLWITRILGERGQSSRGVGTRWPVSVIVAVVGTGVATFIGILAMAWPLLGGAGLTSSQIPYLAVAWVIHTSAFAGLLTRKNWARWISGILSAGWGSIMTVQILDHLLNARPVTLLELIAAVGITALLFGLASHLVFGKGPREFMDSSVVNLPESRGQT